MSELGTKHECIECGCKFYDLGKSPVVCPKCGTDQAQPEAGQTSAAEPKQASPEGRPKTKSAKPAEPDDEDEEIVDDDELLDTEALDDDFDEEEDEDDED